MLINVDVKGLEWVGINWFAQDPVGCQEIRDGVDQHAGNQKAFNLPDRTTAKRFVFKLLYGGTAPGYAQDADYLHISTNKKFWQEVIDKFYGKYRGIAIQHTAWMDEAMATGMLVMPTGRVYEFKPYENKYGQIKWPRTTIINYPVQGLGADLVAIFRVSLFRRLANHPDRANIKFIQTVHDSVVLDTPSRNLESICSVISGCFADLPANFSRIFGVDFNLPLNGEISCGNNLLELTDVNP